MLLANGAGVGHELPPSSDYCHPERTREGSRQTSDTWLIEIPREYTRDDMGQTLETPPMRFLSLLVVSLLLMTMAASCKREDQLATSTQPSRGGKQTLKIVYIPKNTGNPYFEPLIEGLKKAAEEAGAEFAVVAPASAE